MPDSPKLLVLALDSATHGLLDRWMAEGALPNLARAFGRGLVADTRSMEAMEVGATWSSIYTGLDPAGHGICWTDRTLPGTYRQQRLTPRDLQHMVPFWKLIADAGIPVGIMDVPFAPAPGPINGFHVVDWGVHDGVNKRQCFPRSLQRRIDAKYGVHPPPATCDTERLDRAGYLELRDRMVRGVELRGEMTRELLGEYDWRFALQVFNEIHCSGHLFWHYHDPGHPAHDPDVVAADGDLLKQVYQATDREIGLILDAVGSDVNVMILTMHSMEHTTGSSLLLPHILERLGAMKSASGRFARPTEASPGSGEHSSGGVPPRSGLKSLLKRVVPRALGEWLYERRQWVNTHWLHRGFPRDIIPAETRAFQDGFGVGATYTGIRLNLVGREPEGVLRRGEEVDEFVDRLREQVAEVVDPDTGKPLMKRLIKTSDLYQGPRLEDLPDLLVEWHTDQRRGTTNVGNGAGGLWRGYSDRIGAIEHPNGSGRTGSHRLEGKMTMVGPSVAPGRLDRVVTVIDLAPTILAMMGVESPPLDGRVVEEFVAAGSA